MYRLFFVLISFLVSPSFAADVANLYQSQIPVSSQSEEEREKVAPDVLRQVILKVVGDRSALDTTDLAPVLAQTQQLLQQYQYHRMNIISDDLTQPDRLAALLSFDKEKLNDSLTQMGLPIWGDNRPEVLIWLALEENNTRTILSTDDNDSMTIRALTEAATMRGLPILLPVMDLQDQTQVTFSDLSAGFSESVEAASQRYGSPVILMVKAIHDDTGLLRANWHARINGESEQWQSRGDLNTAITAGINELTDRLARRFSQLEAKQYEHILSLEIMGVANYSDYARLEKYLRNLQNVSRFQIDNFMEDTVKISLLFNGDEPVLDRTLAIDRVLIEQSPSSFLGTKRYRLSF